MAKPKIGVALGMGAALGWAHIGIIRALQDENISIGAVSGCSMGSVVGGALAAGKLDILEEWAKSLSIVRVGKYLDVGLHSITGKGLLQGEKIMDTFAQEVGDLNIENSPLPLGIVATDLMTGEEVRFLEGSMVEASRSSISVPGLFAPHYYRDRWLVDGGLVNPVPVDVCRELGADVVIAIDVLNSDVEAMWEARRNKPSALTQYVDHAMAHSLMPDLAKPFWKKARDWVHHKTARVDHTQPPKLYDTLDAALNIMERVVMQRRFEDSPPDILVRPPLHDLRVYDFHRAEDAITIGYDAMKKAMPEVRKIIESQSV